MIGYSPTTGNICRCTEIILIVVNNNEYDLKKNSHSILLKKVFFWDDALLITKIENFPCLDDVQLFRNSNQFYSLRYIISGSLYEVALQTQNRMHFSSAASQDLFGLRYEMSSCLIGSACLQCIRTNGNQQNQFVIGGWLGRPG
jgi:hypothetical protein